MNYLCLLAVTGLSLITQIVVRADTNQAALGIIQRFAPAHSHTFRLESIPAENGFDTYEIESISNKIVLRGNSGVAQASAFYHYLKEFCHAHVSWNGDNLSLPKELPAVLTKIRVVSPVKHRMAYNYCTHGYTMPFWNQQQWQRELDWLALHGINMALIIEGQDAVWQQTFTRFGYSREEMRLWLCSPVHQPWQWMQNMQATLPPPQSIIDQRAALGQWIVSHCRDLGIQPILQGYYGMLPSGFHKKFPAATIYPQGTWAGGNTRPDMLDPSDPLFPKIAATFYEEQKKQFGPALYFAADPFHEGGSSAGMNRGTVYQQVQEALLTNVPNATLVKQCWQTSNKEMFDAGNKDRSLALDLWCDARPFWQKANAYSGTPWGWCFLFNFGGNLALEGNPLLLAKNFGNALSDPHRMRLEATAIVPEGSSTNPMMYELMTEMGWRGAPTDPHAWISNYLLARYGKKVTAADDAWNDILDSAYAVQPAEGPINSVITARPSTNKNIKGRTWSPGSRVDYNPMSLASAWTKLLAAAPDLGPLDTYRYDLADVTRQVLVNLSRPIFEQTVDAITANDREAFTLHSSRFLNLLDDLDELTATRREWLMGAWIADARSWGQTPAEQAYMESCARMILTTWVDNPNTDLSDYANREWNGLLGQYYAARWKLFFSAAQSAIMANKAIDQNAYDHQRAAFESSWLKSNKPMLASPAGDTLAISKRLHTKYLPLFTSYYPQPLTRELVIGTWNYRAHGSHYLREFRADGSVHAYHLNGTPLDWFDGFTWELHHGTLVLSRGNQRITLTRGHSDQLLFASEGFGEATKVATPPP